MYIKNLMFDCLSKKEIWNKCCKFIIITFTPYNVCLGLEKRWSFWRVGLNFRLWFFNPFWLQNDNNNTPWGFTICCGYELHTQVHFPPNPPSSLIRNQLLWCESHILLGSRTQKILNVNSIFLFLSRRCPVHWIITKAHYV